MVNVLLFLVLLVVCLPRIAHLVVPAINPQITTVRNVFELRAIDGSAIRGELTTEIWVIIRAGLVEGSDIAIATTPLAVGLGVVSVEIVTARESTVAARYPANMRLFLGVALHMTLQMFLTLEPTLATGLLALELDLLDDRRQVLETQI